MMIRQSGWTRKIDIAPQYVLAYNPGSEIKLAVWVLAAAGQIGVVDVPASMGGKETVSIMPPRVWVPMREFDSREDAETLLRLCIMGVCRQDQIEGWKL